jgi:hypothetical protein
VDRPSQSRRVTDGRLARRRLAFMWAYARASLRPLARLAGRAMWRALEIPFALLLLFWEWGWRPLSALLGQLRHLRLVARFEAWVVTLPPYPSLAVFALPAVAILPLKLIALWLITGGHTIYAALLFIGAKVIGTALVARLFVLLQPKLMAIGWFKRAYDIVMPWKERVFAAIRASWAWRYGRIVKARVSRIAHHVVATTLIPMKQRLVEIIRRLLRSSTTIK